MDMLLDLDLVRYQETLLDIRIPSTYFFAI